MRCEFTLTLDRLPAAWSTGARRIDLRAADTTAPVIIGCTAQSAWGEHRIQRYLTQRETYS